MSFLFMDSFDHMLCDPTSLDPLVQKWGLYGYDAINATAGTMASTLVTAVSDLQARGLSLWDPSITANGAPPSGWADQDFNDGLWSDVTSASDYAQAHAMKGSTSVWTSTAPRSAAERALVRFWFYLPSREFGAASLSIRNDAATLDVILNGNPLGLTPSVGQIATVDVLSLLQAGSWNLLAMHGDAATSLNAGLSYRLLVSGVPKPTYTHSHPSTFVFGTGGRFNGGYLHMRASGKDNPDAGLAIGSVGTQYGRFYYLGRPLQTPAPELIVGFAMRWVPVENSGISGDNPYSIYKEESGSGGLGWRISLFTLDVPEGATGVTVDYVNTGGGGLFLWKSEWRFLNGSMAGGWTVWYSQGRFEGGTRTIDNWAAIGGRPTQIEVAVVHYGGFGVDTAVHKGTYTFLGLVAPALAASYDYHFLTLGWHGRHQVGFRVDTENHLVVDKLKPGTSRETVDLGRTLNAVVQDEKWQYWEFRVSTAGHVAIFLEGQAVFERTGLRTYEQGMNPTPVHQSAPETAKGLSLWNGSGNDAPPSEWFATSYDDSAWADVVAGDPSPTQPQLSGAYKLATTSYPTPGNPNGAISLFRESFFLADERTAGAAVLDLEIEDALLGVWINGQYIEDSIVTSPSFGSATNKKTIHIPAEVLVSNAQNLIACQVQNTSGGALWVAYRLRVQFDLAPVYDAVYLGHLAGKEGPYVGSSPDWQYDYDDLYVLDAALPGPTAPLGPIAVGVIRPRDAGTSTDFVPSDETVPNWILVGDPSPDNEATHVNAASIGNTDTYRMQNAPNGSAIIAAQYCVTAKKDKASTAVILPVVRSSLGDGEGVPVNPPADYTVLTSPAATNPRTGAAWTSADFNADGAEHGFRLGVKAGYGE